ncbi:MAG: PEP-CTERM sorting domain-containing protein [Proteobacteria bacterium]|nr:PEP-CTERM sorting domain-containing protein [Pseudomonadota bacterium]
MIDARCVATGSMPTRTLAAALLGAAAVAAHAAPYELIYTGTFNTTEALNLASASTPTYFAATTDFTIHSFFDDSSPNLTGLPFPSFRAYSPSLTTITINGSTYTVDPASVNASAGVAVAIFDTDNPFNNGRYGIGLIADVANDGAGIVGDFQTASPDFIASALTATTFTNYYGVGHGSGVCTSGFPPACPHEVTPWVLHDGGGDTWSLTLGNYEEDYPVAHTPGAPVGLLNTAQIVAVPEPATTGLMLAGLGGLAWLSRRRRARA